MKKIILAILLVFLFTVPAMAQTVPDTWYKTLSGTVAWDAVTTYEDGSPLAPTDVMTYNVYIKNVTTGVETKIGATPSLLLSIVIPNRGKYRVGIQSELSPTEISAIGWSDNPVICSTAGTFGFRLMFPAGAKNLKKQ